MEIKSKDVRVICSLVTSLSLSVFMYKLIITVPFSKMVAIRIK